MTTEVEFDYNISRESATIVLNGDIYTLKKGDPNFEEARDKAQDEDIEGLLVLFSKGHAIEKWTGGLFRFHQGYMMYNGRRFPPEMNKRMVAMAEAGDDPTAIMKFWQRLSKNPSWRAVKSLWGFLKSRGICIDLEGHILAYKAVNPDYTSVHKDEDGNPVDNSIGAKPYMDRNRVSDEYNSPCHTGFHVGNHQYASNYGPHNRRIIVCRVDPANVVCICNTAQKMRINTYEVIGNYGALLPDTVYDISKDGLVPNPAGGTPEVESVLDEMGPGEEEPTTAPEKGASPSAVSSAAHSFAALLGKEKGTVATPPEQRVSWDLSLVPDEALVNENMANLRKYASNFLKIVGASRLRKLDHDGEEGLITVLIRERQRRRREVFRGRGRDVTSGQGGTHVRTPTSSELAHVLGGSCRGPRRSRPLWVQPVRSP